MPLFIDRLPFHVWIDGTRTPPSTFWSVVAPIIVTESNLPAPPQITLVQDWVVDTGNRGEAHAWRHHLLQAGLDPDQNRSPLVANIRTVAGSMQVPIRDADLWLVSNLTPSPPPYRIILERGVAFVDVPTLPDPYFQRPLIGIRALRSARLRVEIDFAADTLSVWTPDPPAP